MTILGLTTYFFCHQIGLLFSTDMNVVAIVCLLAPITASFQLLDGFQTMTSCVLRAMGMQTRSALIYGVGFWLFGVPGGSLMCFKLGLGVMGLWYGIVCGLVVVGILSAWTLLRVDWHEQALRAMERTQIPTEINSSFGKPTKILL